MCPKSIDATEDESTEIFRKSWQTYQHIIEHNHLKHQDVVDALAKELTLWNGPSGRGASEGCRVMDLGCGDAWLPIRLLSGSQTTTATAAASAAASASASASALATPPVSVSRFVGVDLSAPALEFAKRNAQAAGWTDCCDWVLGDISEISVAPVHDSEKFDIIVSSFAIHHLKTKESKAKLLSGIYDRLAPGGLFLWADVYDYIGNGDRSRLMARWKEKIVEGYHGIPQEERDRIWDHASNHDWPESKPTMQSLLEGAGFRAKCIYHDDFYVAVWSGIKDY